MAMFLGHGTFLKCWIRICLFAGARVQLKRKMAPYLKRPMYYGFDALAWNRNETKKKQEQLKKAVAAFYGNMTRGAFSAWKSERRIKQDSQDEATRVLKNFLAMCVLRLLPIPRSLELLTTLLVRAGGAKAAKSMPSGDGTELG